MQKDVTPDNDDNLAERVTLAELRAREAEAVVRLLEAKLRLRALRKQESAGRAAKGSKSQS
jgi:hypothetical protein